MLGLAEGPEWVEIMNRTNQPISLTGWTLTDDSGRVARFPDVVLVAEGYRVIASDREVLPDGWSPVAGWPTR
jgi:hypothetical protein